MSSYRECPSCRALLTSGQLSAGAGVCPYCGGKLTLDRDSPYGSDLDLENPYAPPRSALGDGRSRLPIPASFGGKMVMAFRLLFGQLPLFAALVLTIWVPGHLLIDMAIAGNPNQADTLVVLQLGQLVEFVFGQIPHIRRVPVVDRSYTVGQHLKVRSLVRARCAKRVP